MVCMHTLSRHLPIVCGGTGAITLMVGAAILTMAGDGTAGTVRVGVSAGAAGTAVVGGDTIIITTTTIILDGIMEAVVIGEMHIPIDVHLEVLVEIGSLPMEEVQQLDVLLM